MPRRARRAPWLLVLLAAALAGGACGEPGDREDVGAYIREANAIQDRGAPDLAAANAAYARFSRGRRLGPAALATLQDAVGRLRETRRRLAQLSAPEPARALRRRLLAVFDANIALAGEAALLGVYVPASRRVMARLPRIASDLRRGLDAAGPQAQEAALGRYGRRLAGLEDRMRALSPPPVLIDSHRGQLLRLATARGLSRRLRAAVADRDGPAVSSLLLRFRDVFVASRLDSTVQRRALRAYRDRLGTINDATGELRREQARLQRSLG